MLRQRAVRARALWGERFGAWGDVAFGCWVYGWGAVCLRILEDSRDSRDSRGFQRILEDFRGT